MVRWLAFALTVLSLFLTAAPAAAQDAGPRINPLTGRPYSPQYQAEYERRQRQDAELDRRMQAASDQYEKEFEEIRARAADQVRKFDTEVETWRATHAAPAGTTESFIVSRYSGETALPESATITYYNRWNEPTHRIEFGADGKPTGPVIQTQQGKAWETIGPRIPAGGGVASYYGKDFDGNEVIRFAEIYGPDGRTVATFDFNFEGLPWQGELFDPKTEQRTGGFLREDMKPPEPTLGGPLAEPAGVRLVTGVCSQCRPLADEHNDLAARINRIVAEMKSLSQQHQHAFPPAQKPLQMRHQVLAAELAQLMPRFEALRARVLECEKQCRAAEARPKEEPLPVMPDRPAPQPDAEPPLVEPTIPKANFKPGSGAIPTDNRDLKMVIDAAQAYIDAVNCDGMECPVCDCDEARKSLQALADMEAYLVAMQPYINEANADHLGRFKNVALNNITNGQQRDRTIRAIALHQFYQDFGSMMLDIASIGSWVKEVLDGDGLDDISALEMMDKLDGIYESAKDLESLLNTGAESLTGQEQKSPVADIVGDGPNKDAINDLKSYASDLKGVIAGIVKEGGDWRKAMRTQGGAAAIGQSVGRILKWYAGKQQAERKQYYDDLLREAEAGDIQQAQAFLDWQKMQARKQMFEDALAAVRAARAAYVGCVWKACGPMTLTRPTIPNFVEDVPGAKPKLSWGKALPWFNEAIARTLPKMKPVAFREGDCPKEKKDDPRTAGDPPAAQGDAPALSRPQFIRVPDLQLPPSFCSEEARNAYMTDVYNPAAANALRNATVASEHQGYLNEQFTKHMRANSPWWGQVRAERDAFEAIVAESAAKSEALRQLYSAILAVPIIPCDEPPPRTATGPSTPPVEDVPVIPGTPTVPVPPATPKPKDDDCPPKEGRKPIVVGPNSKVGTGAQLTKKLGGMALGALAGAAGLGGGGGGGGGEPQLWTCKIKDSEMTVFKDPATGVSIAIAAKRAGDKIVVFSDIRTSPDKGTFQTAWMEKPSTGAIMPPGDIGPCDLWGEWKLTVSWTKTTYVDGKEVFRESGGWSEGGKFRIPGFMSKVDAPDGFWKRMGMSTATSGVRKMANIFTVAPGQGPMTYVVHVTRPKGDPVTTVPFAVTLTEGPGGVFTVTKAEDPPCPEDDFDFSSGPSGLRTILTNDAGMSVVLGEDGKPVAPPPGSPEPMASKPRGEWYVASDLGPAYTESGKPLTAAPAGDEPPESILDDVDEGPPVLTGGTGIAADRPASGPGVGGYQPTMPKPPLPSPPTGEPSRRPPSQTEQRELLNAENLVDEWLADDLKLLDQMHAPDACTPDLRRKLIEQIEERMKPPEGRTREEAEANEYIRMAQAADRARSRALLDWLSENPEACRPPSTIPREAYRKPDVPRFEPAPADYTPADDDPDLGPPTASDGMTTTGTPSGVGTLPRPATAPPATPTTTARPPDWTPERELPRKAPGSQDVYRPDEIETYADELLGRYLKEADELLKGRSCDEAERAAWFARRDALLKEFNDLLKDLKGYQPKGPLADGVREEINRQIERIKSQGREAFRKLEKVREMCPSGKLPTDPESILDDIDDVFSGA